MAGSVLIVILSGCMFVYWFRYMCRLLLSNRLRTDHARFIVQAYSLSFRHLPQGIDEETARLLRRDYVILKHLLAKYRSSHFVEIMVLRVDYALMALWARVARPIAPGMALLAFREMVDVLDSMSAIAGQQSALRHIR